MRSGLLRFNEYTGTPNSDTRGYHETLTRFWAYTIWLFVHSEVPVSRLDAVRSAISEFGGDTKLPDRHYGRNLTTDVIARRPWIPPNDAFARAVSFFDDLLAAVLAIVPIPERTKSAAERIRLQGVFRWVRLYELQSREIELVASSGDDDDLFVPDVYDVPSELVGQVLRFLAALGGTDFGRRSDGRARKAEQQAMLRTVRGNHCLPIQSRRTAKITDSMTETVTPARVVSGAISVPGDKSISHRFAS